MYRSPTKIINIEKRSNLISTEEDGKTTARAHSSSNNPATLLPSDGALEGTLQI